MSKTITYNFTEDFLDNLVDYLDLNYLSKNVSFKRLAIVFGGKRPALFLKKRLFSKLKTSYIPPKIYSIDEFITEIVSEKELLKTSYDLDNCYVVYNLVKEIAPDILIKQESFSRFLPWAREIVKFIDQLDLEHISNDKLLNIENNAQIGYNVPDDINSLLSKIVKIRDGYHKYLNKHKLTTRGLTYLTAAQNVNNTAFEEYDEIIFCNFFYFNESEELILKNLYDRGKATFIFQGDRRRWSVFEKISQNFNIDIREPKFDDAPKYNLKLYSAFDLETQVATVKDILTKTNNLDNTVVVLPDPKNIIPLITEVASIEKEFNISMGYPLKRSSLYTLIEFIFQSQLSKKDGKYYSKDYIKTLRHPFVKNLKISGNDSVVTRILVHKIEEILTGKYPSEISGSVFVDLNEVLSTREIYDLSKEMLERLNIDITFDQLKDVLNELHRQIFLSWEDVCNFESFASLLNDLIDCLIKHSIMRNYPLNINIAARTVEHLNQLKETLFNKEKFSLDDIFRIFENKITNEIVKFSGSPLKGLQLLGLFEVRSLNFENVIVMDVNEGVLPYLNIYEPLIPREVMLLLGLDRLEVEEEIQRYQFLRLISSAKNVHLVYQENKEKERSRFVEHLIWENEKNQRQIGVLPVYYNGFRSNVDLNKKSFKKTPEIIELLKNFTYSASSINTYLKDPVEFYYRYVLGLRETEDLLDEPEAKEIGTFVHGLLEDAFKPLLNKKPLVDTDFRSNFNKLFEDRFSSIIAKSLKSDSFLLKRILTEKLERFLEMEAESDERAVEKILYLEKRFKDKISLDCGEFNFIYIVDRIDQMSDGSIMIVDYKTGSVSQMPKGLDIINRIDLTRESIYENVRSMQIPLYFNYFDKYFEGKQINACLYSLRDLKINSFLKSKDDVSVSDINLVYKKVLNSIMSEIINPDINFES